MLHTDICVFLDPWPVLLTYSSVFNILENILKRIFHVTVLILGTYQILMLSLCKCLCSHYTSIWYLLGIEGLAFLLCIQELPDSDLSPETGYPDSESSFPFFYQPLWEWWDSALVHNSFLPSSSQFIIHFPFYYSTLYSLSYWKCR
jgi:hypothetical protein